MAECGFAEVGCKVSEAMGGVTDDLTTQIKEAVEMFIEATFTGWLSIPVPIIGEGVGPASFLRENTMWIATSLMTIAVTYFCIVLIFKPKAQTVSEAGAYLLRVMVVVGGSITLGSMVISFCDGYATWILDRALLGDTLATTLLNTLQIVGPTGFLVAAVFGIIGICFSFLQGFLLIARNAMLPILVGAAPLAVSLSNLPMGQSWWQKYMSWFIAFLLYKPTAATIYAVGFWWLGEGDIFGATTVGEAALAGMNGMYGATLLFLSFVAFGALMTVVTPVVGKLTGGMAGAGMMAVSAGALAASGVIGRGSSIRPPAGPTNVTPSNRAAGGPAGTPGPTGTQGSPSRGGTGVPTPAGQAVKIAADTAGRARDGIRTGINNDKDEN
jgi:type IV secretion system protein TrbL